MKIIAINKTTEISGGNPAAAIAMGATVFTGAAAIGQSLDYFNSVGHRIGESLYNHYHPQPMGQMVYYR